MQPDIRYAQSSGAAIAYQVIGNADTDLVFVPDFGSNLIFGWQSPHWRDFYERLARTFRLILFDKRGSGARDPLRTGSGRERARNRARAARGRAHTGECELHEGKVAGIAVSVGARVAGSAAPGEVIVTATVRDLVAGSGIEFEGRDERELKGVQGKWSLYAAR
jgi:pimeloyl-ACP methyl ester carboxylesterase